MKITTYMKHYLVMGVLTVSVLTSSIASAEGTYDTGASDTEIIIGQTVPYSGAASAMSTIGRLHSAYFKNLNEQGGINGRKVTLLSLDDAFNPAKTVEQTRKLVEQEEVLLMFAPYGTPTSMAVRKYLNRKKIPQLFVVAGGNTWGDHKNYPWTMGWMPRYEVESRIHADFILQNNPEGKIAVLYQNDDFGKELLEGLRSALGDRASMIVAEQSYEVTDATVNSQISSLKASGANILLSYSLPKFTAQAISRVYDLGWQPLHIVNQTSTGVGAVIVPAGVEKSKNVRSAYYVKDPTDPLWKDDTDMAAFRGWMIKNYPEGDINDISNLFAYAMAETLVDVLKRSGDMLTRENIMQQAQAIDMKIGIMLPGVRVKTSPTDFYPVEAMQLMTFDGSNWSVTGQVIDKAVSPQ